jgi:heme oxygenase (mycobilin-producing)
MPAHIPRAGVDHAPGHRRSCYRDDGRHQPTPDRPRLIDTATAEQRAGAAQYARQTMGPGHQLTARARRTGGSRDTSLRCATGPSAHTSTHSEDLLMSQASQPARTSPVTLINVFEVPADHVDAFIAGWCHRAALMSTKPGFLDTRLHRAISPQDRFQLVNIAHWTSAEDMQAATADPEFQQRTRAATADPQVPISANPALYQVAVEFSAPAPPEHRRASPSR